MICIAVMLLGAVGYIYWQKYHDRPFINGLNFAGRGYDPGTCFLGTCVRSSSETLFYTTNFSPGELQKHLPGWKIKMSDDTSVGQDVEHKYVYVLDGSESVQFDVIYHSGLDYVVDKYQLKKSSEGEYLVSLGGEGYATYLKNKKD